MPSSMSSNKYAPLHQTLCTFLRCITAAILHACKVTRPQLPESKDMGMGILCEFIEDCEYPNLSASVLHILGQHGPSSATPSKFVKLPR